MENRARGCAKRSADSMPRRFRRELPEGDAASARGDQRPSVRREGHRADGANLALEKMSGSLRGKVPEPDLFDRSWSSESFRIAMASVRPFGE